MLPVLRFSDICERQVSYIRTEKANSMKLFQSILLLLSVVASSVPAFGDVDGSGPAEQAAKDPKPEFMSHTYVSLMNSKLAVSEAVKKVGAVFEESRKVATVAVEFPEL